LAFLLKKFYQKHFLKKSVIKNAFYRQKPVNFFIKKVLSKILFIVKSLLAFLLKKFYQKMLFN